MSWGKFSRRAFLKGLGIASAAFGTTKLSSTPAEAQTRQQMDRNLRVSEYPGEHFRIRRQPIQWPNNARIAICWVVNFEGYTDNSNSYEIAYIDYSCKAGLDRFGCSVRQSRSVGDGEEHKGESRCPDRPQNGPGQPENHCPLDCPPSADRDRA